MTNFSALQKNLTDTLLESQLKIGYTPNAVGLYYPLDSLNRTLGTNCTDAEMQTLLESFPEEPLGKIAVSHKKDRFCLTIPEEGVRYVHEHVQDSGFLTAFIQLMQEHHHDMTIEMLADCFRQFSDNVECREVDDDEFTHLLYFADGQPDDYRYCIDLEFGHATYHRFTPADFEAFGFIVK